MGVGLLCHPKPYFGRACDAGLLVFQRVSHKPLHALRGHPADQAALRGQRRGCLHRLHLATPINQQAILLGADLVLHSATKYLGGHNDVLAGAIAGRADLVKTVRAMHNILGGTIDPHAAYLLLRGRMPLPWNWRSGWRPTRRCSGCTTLAWSRTLTTPSRCSRWPHLAA